MKRGRMGDTERYDPVASTAVAHQRLAGQAVFTPGRRVILDEMEDGAVVSVIEGPAWKTVIVDLDDGRRVKVASDRLTVKEHRR